MTRSLPATIALPPSLAAMLAIRMKRLASVLRVPSMRRAMTFSGVVTRLSTKHFWLARMVVRMTSGGISRNGLLERADQHHRPFDQPGDLLEQPLVLDQLEAERQRLVARVGEDHLLAAVGIENDLGAFELGHVVVEAAAPRSAPAP